MKYGCIGYPLGHSFSADIHGALGRYEYTLKELPPDEVDVFLKEKNFSGINVTIPYKQTVIPYLDEIDEAARRIGAVNTIVNRGGKLCGYNTDFGGMRAQILRAFGRFDGEKVLILGTGGTSRTAVHVAESLGACEVFRVSRSGKEGALTYEEAYAGHRDAGVLINTSPVGMYPNISGVPVDLAEFPGLKFVFDAVFNPLNTRLVAEAKARGIPAEAGLYMLVTQAMLAAEKFLGESLPEGIADEIFAKVASRRRNIVLIGMPACGKSTVGRILAEKLGRELIDTDEQIEREAGRTIPQIFAEEGEAGFRRIERGVIASLAGKSGIVLATGGGAVLNEENAQDLKLNGRLYWIDRSPELLIPTADRPLAADKEAIFRRYAERRAIYERCADLRVPGDGSPDEVAEQILLAHS